MNWICKAIAACLANKAHSFSSAQLLGNKTFGACCSYKAVLQKPFRFTTTSQIVNLPARQPISLSTRQRACSLTKKLRRNNKNKLLYACSG